jgi:hypothetical protein
MKKKKKCHQNLRERYLCLKDETCYVHPTPVSSWSVVLKLFIFFVSSINKSNFHRYPPLVITEGSTFFSCKTYFRRTDTQHYLARPKHRQQYDNVSCTIPCGYRLKT